MPVTFPYTCSFFNANIFLFQTPDVSQPKSWSADSTLDSWDTDQFWDDTAISDITKISEKLSEEHVRDSTRISEFTDFGDLREETDSSLPQKKAKRKKKKKKKGIDGLPRDTTTASHDEPKSKRPPRRKAKGRRVNSRQGSKTKKIDKAGKTTDTADTTDTL